MENGNKINGKVRSVQCISRVYIRFLVLQPMVKLNDGGSIGNAVGVFDHFSRSVNNFFTQKLIFRFPCYAYLIICKNQVPFHTNRVFFFNLLDFNY